MTNNRTLLGKLGFDDGDSKTPIHDEILNLIMKDSIIFKIANKLELQYKDKDGTWKQMIFNDNDHWIKNEEFILKTKSNFVVGVIDLRTSITKEIYKTGDCDNWFIETCTISEKLCTYKDFKECSNYKEYVNTEGFIINIEVKGEIKSVGQLIRQVNVYKEFIDGPFVVIAPYIEDSYRNRLRDANIFPISMDEVGLPTIWRQGGQNSGFIFYS